MDLACSGFALPVEHSVQHNAGAFCMEHVRFFHHPKSTEGGWMFLNNYTK